MKTALLLLALASLLACAPPDLGDGDGACELAAEFDGCPECADGETTCTFQDVSVTAVSCGECQARSELFAQLCDDGVVGARDAIESATSCTTVPLQ